MGATDTVRLHFSFPINSSRIDVGFMNNGTTLDSLRSVMTSMDTSGIQVYGAASPDGRLKTNRRLADGRMRSVVDYISREYGIPGSMIHPRGSSIPWREFRRMLADEPRVLSIVNQGSDDSEVDVAIRFKRIRALDGGRVWHRLKTDVFPRLRGTDVVLVIEPSESPVDTVAVDMPVIDNPEPVAEKIIVPDTVVVESLDTVSEPVVDTSFVEELPIVSDCTGAWHLGTNAVAWGMGISNLTGELDVACRWSVALSVYYSGWNYFKSTRKFRTFIFRPEARYWLTDGHRGLYIRGHLQMAAYNFALQSWTYRIQDVGGKHPALGGGVGLGYRLPLGKNGRWALEGAIGAGVYHIEYDRFLNRHDGSKVDTRRETWFGVDNVSVGVVFNFNPR